MSGKGLCLEGLMYGEGFVRRGFCLCTLTSTYMSTFETSNIASIPATLCFCFCIHQFTSKMPELRVCVIGIFSLLLPCD